jgi:hypothetical protein
VALNPLGVVVGRTDDAVKVGRRTSAAELIEVLRRWAPKVRVAEVGRFDQHGVSVRMSLERDSTGGHWLAGTFAPHDADTHLYGMSLPAAGIDGLGRPTYMVIEAGPVWTALGPATADRLEELDRIDALNVALPVYPAGAITLRAPVLVRSASSHQVGVVRVGFMACSRNGCLPPVRDRRVAVQLPPIAQVQ